MLEEVDEKIKGEVVIGLLVMKSSFCFYGHSFRFARLHDVDCVPEESGFEEPLAKRPGREAPISAWFPQTAVAADPVDNVEDAQSYCDTVHFALETQIGQEIVVEEIEQYED